MAPQLNLKWHLLAGPGALAILLLIGAHPIAVAAGLITYAAATQTTPTTRATLLLAAPLAAFITADATNLAAMPGLAAIAAAWLATYPVFKTLGGRMPIPHLPTAIAPLLLAAGLATPWAATLFASDVAARSQVLILTAATLILLLLRPTTARREALNAA